MSLEETLEQVFFRTAAVYGKKYPPRREEVLEVVNMLAATMKDMKLTIISSNLLPAPKRGRPKKDV